MVAFCAAREPSRRAVRPSPSTCACQHLRLRVVWLQKRGREGGEMA